MMSSSGTRWCQVGGASNLCRMQRIDPGFAGTEEVTPYSFTYGGHNFTLIDTPGFNDSRSSDDIIAAKVLTWLRDSAEQGRELSGIIYVHRILEPRSAT